MHVALSPSAASIGGTAGAHGPASTPRSFGAVLDARLGSPPATPPADRSTIHVALEALEQARTDLDAAVAAAGSGRTFSPAELLALQSRAFRYGQSVELASKVVEQAAQAVKQAVNTQV